jgi:hypothetical protein
MILGITMYERPLDEFLIVLKYDKKSLTAKDQSHSNTDFLHKTEQL